jgi:hypothetical protein
VNTRTTVGALVVVYIALSPTASIADECEYVRPFRSATEEYSGTLSIEGSTFAKRLLGLAAGGEGTVSFKEQFPESDKVSLQELQNIYYIACHIILESEIDPERKLAMLLQIRSESQTEIKDTFLADVKSDDPFKKTEAIDWATSSDDPRYRAIAVEEALKSESPAIKGRLLEIFLFDASTISGEVETTDQAERTQSYAFALRTSNFERTAGHVNFVGSFEGGAFVRMSNKAENDNVSGTIRGNSIHASNKWCSLSGELTGKIISGRLTCDGGFMLQSRIQAVTTGIVRIPVF